MNVYLSCFSHLCTAGRHSCASGVSNCFRFQSDKMYNHIYPCLTTAHWNHACMQYLAHTCHTTQSASSCSALGEALISALMKIQVFWDDAVLTGKYFPSEKLVASIFIVYAVGTLLGLQILKMEAANSPADLLTTYQLIRRHIPEDLIPPNSYRNYRNACHRSGWREI